MRLRVKQKAATSRGAGAGGGRGGTQREIVERWREMMDVKYKAHNASGPVQCALFRDRSSCRSNKERRSNGAVRSRSVSALCESRHRCRASKQKVGTYHGLPSQPHPYGRRIRGHSPQRMLDWTRVESTFQRELKYSKAGGQTSRVGSSSSSTGPLSPDSLARKGASILALLVLVRAGQYLPIAGLDKEAFTSAIGANTNILEGMQQALTGGGVAKFGIFSLGIVPAINASIAMQLFTVLQPNIKKLLREEGDAGRRRYLQYQRLVTLGFAMIQALGTASSFRPYVQNFSFEWEVLTIVSLVTGAIVTMYVSETIDEFKLGNGSSLIIFMNILSSLPASIGASVQSSSSSSSAVVGAVAAVMLLTAGIVYVQEAERKLPLNYAQQYTDTTLSLQRESYLPLKINSSGVMPIILSSSFLSFPTVLAQLSNADWLRNAAIAVGPNSILHLPLELGLIAYFNSFYTFLQLDPKDVSENLQKSGASLVGVRPGKATAEELKDVRLSHILVFFLNLQIFELIRCLGNSFRLVLNHYITCCY